MKPKASRFYSIVLIVLFLLLLSTPFAINILGLNKSGEISKSENRNLAKKPNINNEGFRYYPQSYESWYNDHFIYRDNFLFANTVIGFLFNKSPAPKDVAMGKDNWLFYNTKEMDVYKGDFMLPSDTIQMILSELQYRVAELNKRNIKFYLMILPTKAEIYPENLPKYIKRAKDKTVTDKIIEKIKSDPKINLITCKEELIEAKKQKQTYFKNDNHWNEFGAFIGYQKLIKRIAKDFPLIVPSKIGFISDIKKGGNLANMIGLEDYLFENTSKFSIEKAKAVDAPKGNYPCIEGFAYPQEYEIDKQVANSRLPIALIIRDSYCVSLMPLLSEHFRRSVYIFDSWQYRFNLDIIEAEKPDVVVLEIFEPHISNMLNNLSYQGKPVKQ